MKYFYILLFGMAFLIVSSSLLEAEESDILTEQQTKDSDNTSINAHRLKQESLDEINKKLNNPVASIWNLNIQNDFNFLEGSPSGSTRFFYNMNFLRNFVRSTFFSRIFEDTFF